MSCYTSYKFVCEEGTFVFGQEFSGNTRIWLVPITSDHEYYRIQKVDDIWEFRATVFGSDSVYEADAISNPDCPPVYPSAWTVTSSDAGQHPGNILAITGSCLDTPAKRAKDRVKNRILTLSLPERIMYSTDWERARARKLAIAQRIEESSL